MNHPPHYPRQPAPNEHWCVGCSPDNCQGCRSPSDSAESACVLSTDRIRSILLSYDFTVKPGQPDLKPYVFQAARALISAALDAAVVPSLPVAPADPGFVYHYHATAQSEPGCVAHNDGCVVALYPVTTLERYTEVRNRIAAACGLAHAGPEDTLF